MIVSVSKKNNAAQTLMMNTMAVVIPVSFRVGQVTLLTSWRTSRINRAGFVLVIITAIPCYADGFSTIGNLTLTRWQEWRDSNPQPPVLETGALPIELHSFDYGTPLLIRDTGNYTGTNSSAAFADSKT